MNKFKKANKPAACTQPPWAAVLPKDEREALLRQIRQESIQFYGYSLDECPKRLTCLTKQCMGRTLPWLSPTAKPYLEKLKETHRIDNDELFLDNCNACAISNICKTACAQVNDFMQRDRIKEPQLDYRGNIENLADKVEMPTPPSFMEIPNVQIPWDALSAKRQQTVKKYLYEQKDFLTIAKELGYTDQKDARYEYYAALTILSEYAIMRKFVNTTGHKLKENTRNILISVYFHNINVADIANEKGITRRAVRQVIERTVKKYKIAWPIFVRKEGNKVIYTKSEVVR